LAQIKVVIEEGLNNIMTFRKDEGVSLEKEFQLRIEKFWQYMTDTLALDLERVNKRPLTNGYWWVKSKCRWKSFWTRINLLFRKTGHNRRKGTFNKSSRLFLRR
jgi:hypothetical protein